MGLPAECPRQRERCAYRCLRDKKPLAQEIALNIFPNPAHDLPEVEVSLVKETNLYVSAQDVMGRVITSDQFSGPEGMNRFILPLTDLRSGLYFITLEREGRMTVHKFIKG